MSSSLINALLQQTSAVVFGADRDNVAPGQPYAREAPLTPYEYSASVTIGLRDEARLEYLLSMPAAVLDALVSLEAPEPEARAAALAECAGEIVRRAIAAASPDGEARSERPQIVVGCDVVLPCLRTGGRRVCMPWETGVGVFVVEAGVANAA